MIKQHINIIQNNVNLNSSIVIDAYPREDKKNIIPSGKYIRGMFDLKENFEGKIYYIKETKKCTIFFSSNYKNLQIIFDNNTKVQNKTLEYAQIYIINGYIDKFTVKLINNENKTINNSLNINYIFKYETNLDNDIYISSKNITYDILNESLKGNERDFIILFYNKKKKNKSNYSYYLRLYKESDIIKEEDLNTLAITSSKIYYYNESINNDKNQINFAVNNLSNYENYHGYLFVKQNNSVIEKYKVKNFIIKKKKDHSKNYLNLIKIIIIIISLIFVIIFAIFSLFLIRMCKKNKELEEKVKNISFEIEGDDTDSLDEDINQRVSYV